MPRPFLHQSPELRREALATIAEAAGRADYLLEKDIWVVVVLDILFNAPFAANLAFKGGTSLSKAYGAITRFSEDVDLTYDIRTLAADLGNDEDLTSPTRSKANRLSKRIRQELLPNFIADEVLPALTQGFTARGIEAAAYQEACNVFVEYAPASDFPDYVSARVKLEFGARATGEPAEIMPVTCYAAEHLPEFAFPTAAPRVMKVERTFWEKATAMHVFCIQGRYRGDGMGFARHWHDLVRLDDKGLADPAIAARDIAMLVAENKSSYFPEKDPQGEQIDYQKVVGGGLQLVATGEAYEVLSNDYQRMVEAGLLADDAETFEELMKRCEAIQLRANQTS